MLFAALVLERPPLEWSDLLKGPTGFPTGMVAIWLQNAGGVAALGMALWITAYFSQKQGRTGEESPAGSRFFAAAALASFLIYGLLGLWYVAVFTQVVDAGLLEQAWLDWAKTLGGSLALMGVLAPVVLPMLRSLRWGRIWALATLSFKEAVRKRLLFVLALMGLVFLFGDWFVSKRPEDQVRNYVGLVYTSMTILFLLAASLLGAFSIPTDIRNQSIHTIVTKPVNRFEIVLGRFLGYGIILSLGLLVLGFLSLGYVIRGVTPEAAQESYKARVPLFGNLFFFGEKTPGFAKQAGSVGREFGYRSYIGGGKNWAIWRLESLPALQHTQEDQKFEFTFDIFRLSKGRQEEEGRGIVCNFTFVFGDLKNPDGKLLISRKGQFIPFDTTIPGQPPPLMDEYHNQRNLAQSKVAASATEAERAQENSKIERDLAKKFGIYEKYGVAVLDYTTQVVKVPAEFFQWQQSTSPGVPLHVIVAQESASGPTQMLGVARFDLYLLLAENPFWWNFLKGLLGLWFTMLLVLGVAVACSTYLSGVLSWFTTLFLFGAGLFSEYIHQLALNIAPGGGPAESFYRLFTRQSQGMPLEETSAAEVLKGTDEIYRFWLRLFLNIVPDVNRFDLNYLVANGFDISLSQVLMLDNLVPLVGYLLPWAVLAFYLMKFREIANPT